MGCLKLTGGRAANLAAIFTIVILLVACLPAVSSNGFSGGTEKGDLVSSSVSAGAPIITPTPSPTATPKPTTTRVAETSTSSKPAPQPSTTLGAAEKSQAKIKINLSGASDILNIDSDGKTMGETRLNSSDHKISLRVGDRTGILTGKKLLPTTITITVDDNIPALPSGSKLVGDAYECFPGGTTFDPPINLVWQYNKTALPAGTEESSLQVAFYNRTSGSWETVESKVDKANHSISATILHFSQYAVIAPPIKAAAVISTALSSPTTSVPAKALAAPTTAGITNPTIVEPAGAAMLVSSITPRIVSSPSSLQPSQPVSATPLQAQKPFKAPYNPVMVIGELVFFSAVGLTAIYFWKKKTVHQ